MLEGLTDLRKKGYNAVEFFRINFFPTVKDDNSIPKVKERIRYYVPLPAAPLDWSCHCGLYQSDMYIGKHHVEYPDKVLNIPDRPWIYRHYPFRSYQQALNKLKAINNYQFGSRSVSWQRLIESEDFFYKITELMTFRTEGRGWRLRFDILEKDKLRSNNSHNAHDYIRKHWPTYPK